MIVQGRPPQMPRNTLNRGDVFQLINALRYIQMTGLAASGGAARRLISQGGAYLNDSRLTAFDQLITDADLKDGQATLRAGKKRYHTIKVQS